VPVPIDRRTYFILGVFNGASVSDAIGNGRGPPGRRYTDGVDPSCDRPHASAWPLNLLKSADLRWEGAKVHCGVVLVGEKLVDNIDFREQLFLAKLRMPEGLATAQVTLKECESA
jgi:hypothetical protein